METKHTPGEWRVRYYHGKDDGEGEFFVEADNNNKPQLGYGIEILGDDYGVHNGYPREQRLADAKLIAAAPDLLEALQMVYDHVLTNMDEATTPIKQMIGAAIKKATQ